MSDKQALYQSLRKQHQTEGNLNYCLSVFGHHLAAREGYKDMDGMEAVHFYLMQKHNWLPRDVRSMSADELRFALHVEMQGWTLPPEAR